MRHSRGAVIVPETKNDIIIKNLLESQGLKAIPDKSDSYLDSDDDANEISSCVTDIFF